MKITSRIDVQKLYFLDNCVLALRKERCTTSNLMHHKIATQSGGARAELQRGDEAIALEMDWFECSGGHFMPAMDEPKKYFVMMQELKSGSCEGSEATSWPSPHMTIPGMIGVLLCDGSHRLALAVSPF